MDRDPSILLTNDDGIDSPGIRALLGTLSAVGSVTVVAPEEDRSAVGRTVSDRLTVAEHELGYAVSGTPVDAVLFGIEGLGLEPDVVVSGCNEGANLGTYVLGRSGTVSAAIEATFFEIPAIAVSLYVPEARWPAATDIEDYHDAAAAAGYLVDDGLRTDLFEEVDLLNVNVPLDIDDPIRMQVTEPSGTYEMTVRRDGVGYEIADGIWEYMDADRVDDPPGTDRRAVLDGEISVSPIETPAVRLDRPSIQAIVERFNGGEGASRVAFSEADGSAEEPTS